MAGIARCQWEEIYPYVAQGLQNVAKIMDLPVDTIAHEFMCHELELGRISGNPYKCADPRPDLTEGTPVMLVYDKDLSRDCEFVQFLKNEGFTIYFRSKGWYNGIHWLFINLNNKVYVPGIPCVGWAPPMCDHAITVDDFKTIYHIYKKYDGMDLFQFS